MILKIITNFKNQINQITIIQIDIGVVSGIFVTVEHRLPLRICNLQRTNRGSGGGLPVRLSDGKVSFSLRKSLCLSGFRNAYIFC